MKPCVHAARGFFAGKHVMQRWLVAGLVFVSFAAFGTLRSPSPGVNEPHYLAKAKHLWDPQWCARDLFLQSTNAHAVFLTAIGAVTRVASLETTVWVGRIAVWLLLAWSWTLLVGELFPGRWSPLWAAWAYLGLAAFGNFSGEWLIGGVEAKGFSYSFVFFSLTFACRGAWTAACGFAGFAVSLHPVVGVWAVAAGTFAWIWQLVADWRMRRTNSEARLFEKAGLLPVIVLFVCSLPGLIPVVSMLRASPSAEISKQADEIQVLSRLSHHLNPVEFSPDSYAMYGILLMGWCLALFFTRHTPVLNREATFFQRFVAGAMLIAVAGLAIGWWPPVAKWFGSETDWTPRVVGLLKFYPFRLGDLVLPVAVAIMLAGFAEAKKHGLIGKAGLLNVVAAGTFLAMFIWSLFFPAVDRDPSGLSPTNRENWIDVCRWIERETPRDALFLTPKFNFGFKWYAARAEYVAHKDCPQDAAHLIEWQRRLDLVRRWRDAYQKRGFTAEAVTDLQQQTGVDYIVAWTNKTYDPYTATPLYQNGSFAVYRVKQPDDAQ